MTLRELFASPAIAACFDDAALIGGMLSFERALARAEGACGAIPVQRQPRESTRSQARAKFDVRRAGRRGAARRHARDPVRQAPDRAGRASRCRGVALRALGRDQPGRARYRARAVREARRRDGCSRGGIDSAMRWPRWPMRIARRRRSRARCCNRRRRFRSASRSPCWLDAVTRTRAGVATRFATRAPCSSSVARAACSHRSVRGGRRSRRGSRASSISRRRQRPGTACAIAWRGSAPRSASPAK